jgi:hypothetical protein
MATPRKISLPDAPPTFRTLESGEPGCKPPEDSAQVSRSSREKSAEKPDQEVTLEAIRETRPSESISKQDNTKDPKLDSKDVTTPLAQVMVLWVGGVLVAGLVVFAFYSPVDKQREATNALASAAPRFPTSEEVVPEVQVPPMTQEKSQTETGILEAVNATLIEENKPSLVPADPVAKMPSEQTEAISTATQKEVNLEPEREVQVEKQKAPQVSVVAKLKVINVVRGDTLSVRKAPSAASPRIGRIPAGAAGVGLISYAGRQNGRDIWYQVVWNGEVGWVNGSFVDFQ